MVLVTEQTHQRDLLLLALLALAPAGQVTLVPPLALGPASFTSTSSALRIVITSQGKTLPRESPAGSGRL